MKTVLITGATSGIGKSTATVLANEKKYKLILCGRREDRLSQLKSELGSLTEIHTLSFDVRDKNAVFSSIDSLPDGCKEIDILINNAGNAHGLDPIHLGNPDDWDAMIDINVKGLLYVSKAVVPGMVERKQGHIINIGSIAGKDVYPDGNVYCASKFAVDAISQGMRIDLAKHGLKVSEIKPGAVVTEFSQVRFKGDDTRANKIYEGFTPMTPEDVAEIIAFVISRPKHVNIADLIVLAQAQASGSVIYRNQS
ncbi:MAG: SDR family NAD(P)-dependent oxidoreductase [Cyclobacteriaceae bacterium]|nr:SDR family NAD(P)-dependent oxidoreductase [Cyclobacteriaceae bacterium]